MTASDRVVPPRLWAVVSVPPQQRVACQNPGCGHGVYAAIHVVSDEGRLLVLGSTCFARRYGGDSALGQPRFGGGNGRPLTEEERAMLATNTGELLARFEAEEAAALLARRAKEDAAALAREQLERERRQAPAFPPPLPRPGLGGPALSRPVDSPWTWQRPGSSVALLESPEGATWVRVTHVDSTEKLVPWPAFYGWEVALPASIGKPDPTINAISVFDIAEALTTLKRVGFSGPRVGRWQDLQRSRRSQGR